jgi:hypothetical protein
MSDYNSGLPVRTEADGTDERVHVKIVDGTSPAINQMTVDSDKNAHVEIHGNDPSAVDRVIRTSELGALTPDGVYDATNNTKPGNSGIIASVRDVAPSDTTQTQRVTAKTGTVDTDVRALDVSLHDENGNAFSASNPLPITSVDSEGTEINDYNTSASLASGGTNNHDYTVTALKTLKLSRVWASASSKLKIEVQIETGAGTGVFATRFVGFNSTANPNILIPIDENVSVGAGVRVRVIRTNKDNQAQDVYSTISGHEV